MNLEPAFLDVVVEIRKYNLQGQGNGLEGAVRHFEKHLKQANEMDKAYIKDMYYDELLTAKQTMLSAKMRSWHDKVFKHFEMEKRAPQRVTPLFENFVKGITYFEYQKNLVNSVPIYHRFYSCGDGTELYRNDHMICLKGIGRREQNRRKRLIETCYIERLIYDALYRHETLHFPATGIQDARQDDGHLFRLDLTRADYETCFKKCRIEVEVEYTDQLPMRLRVKRTKEGKETSMEEYMRSYKFDRGSKIYDPVVECHKVVGDRQLMKLQTFHKEVNWQKKA